MSTRILILGSILFLLAPLSASGEVYQYTDDNGTISFTDNPGQIPQKFRDKQTLYEDGNIDNSTTDFKYINNQILVPVTIRYNGKEHQATFLMDTGATNCTISPELAKRLNIKSDDTKVGLAQGVGNSVHRVGRTTLEALIVGPHRKANIDISIIPTGRNDGLLGMNFLHGLRYRLNFSTQQIAWDAD
jgi:clan AA aspartic protease (TIGR02281 family)